MTPLPLSPEYYPFIISQQPWKMNTGLQRPIVLQQAGSWCALFNKVNYMIASVNLAVVHSTKSLLTCKSATVFDVCLVRRGGIMPEGEGARVRGEGRMKGSRWVCRWGRSCRCGQVRGVRRKQAEDIQPLILWAKLLRWWVGDMMA